MKKGDTCGKSYTQIYGRRLNKLKEAKVVAGRKRPFLKG